MRKHIIIADDDKRIRELLTKFFSEKGYLVSKAENAAKVRELLEYFIVDLIILDVMMPGETGVELAKSIRSSSQIPIVFLTAMGEIDDRITGLEIGADDYLVKPFDPRELMLRVDRIIKRTREQDNQNNENIIKFGQYNFDCISKRLFHFKKNIILTTSEANLLHIMVQNLGQVVDRSILAKGLGGVNERTVDVQIIRLRNKIESNPKLPVHIQTIRNKGYILHD